MSFFLKNEEFLQSTANKYNEADAEDIESDFLYGLATDNIIDEDAAPESPLEAFTETRSIRPTSYKYDRPKGERSSTPKYKTEMYSPEHDQPLTLKGSLYKDKMLHSMLSMHKKDSKSSRDLSHPHKYSSTFDKSGRVVQLHGSGSHSKSPIKSAWSNGMVSYKEPRYSRSVRLDLSMMSLDEQLNHTQLLNKFNNKGLPTFEVDRLQKQEELM